MCRKRIVRVIAIDEVKGLRTGRKGSSINHKKVDWDPCVMLLIMASLFMPSEFAVLPGVAMVLGLTVWYRYTKAFLIEEDRHGGIECSR